MLVRSNGRILTWANPESWPQGAAAIALIVAKGDQVLNRGGYLRAMTRRDEAGELYISKSFFKLAADRALWH